MTTSTVTVHADPALGRLVGLNQIQMFTEDVPMAEIVPDQAIR
jgi:hypothetical protein